jgi:hypothetical protein
MRPLRPLLLNLAAGLSTALFLATIVLWVRSYAVEEAFTRDGPAALSLHSANGQVGFSYLDRAKSPFWRRYRFRGWSYTTGHIPPLLSDDQPPRTLFHLDRLGFVALYARTQPPYRYWGPPPAPAAYVTARLPLWFLAALFALLPARQFFHPQNRELPRNRCRVCGYDLRATPDRCPECGAVPI